MENSVWAKGNPSLTAGLIPLMITGLVLNMVLIDLICFCFLSDNLGFHLLIFLFLMTFNIPFLLLRLF